MSRSPFTRKLLLVSFVAALVLTLFTSSGMEKVHADCGLGDIICEGQQAIQQLIDQYVGPLQLWLQFTIDKMIYQGLYQLEVNVASAMWSVNKALVTVGVGVGLLIGWVATNFFQPLLSTGLQTFGAITSMFFVIALVLLGLSYVLAMFIRLEVVSMRSALLWYVAAILFFQAAPSIYSGLNDFRQSLSTTFYAASLNAVQNQSPFQALTGGDGSSGSGAYAMSTLCNNFPSQVQNSGGTVSGLDIALAYQRADGLDVMGNNGTPCLGGGSIQTLPRVWLQPGGYFDPTKAPDTWIAPTYPATIDNTQQTMQNAVLQGFGGITRLLNALPLNVFGIIEQLIGFCLAVAEGLAFISFSVAVIFALFKRTEAIAWSVIDLIISLIVQTVIVGAIQGLVVALYISAAGTGSPLVTLAVSVVGLVLMSILLWSGIKAIWNAFNRLFLAFGQATGGAIVTPSEATQTAAGAAMMAASFGAAGVGMLAGGAASGMAGMNALSNGATWAQAAGISMGNNPTLSQSAMTLYRLPGLRGSALGDAADQFLEGARLQTLGEDMPLGGVVSPFLGARLLTDRNPDAVRSDGSHPMLTEAGQAMSVVVRSPRWSEPGDASEALEAQQREERLTQYGVRGEFIPRRAVNKDSTEGDVVGYYDRAGQAIALEDEEDVKRNAELRDDLTVARDGDPERAAELGADTKLTAAADRLGQAADRMDESNRRRQMYEGTFTTSGAGSVGVVMGDLVTLLQQQRIEAGKPALLKAGESLSSFAVAGGLGQALNITPTENKPLIGQDLARYQLYAEQALRLGLDGDMTQDVATQMRQRGALQPQTQAQLRTQVQANTGWSEERVAAEVRTLENRANMLPDQIQAVGIMPVLVQTQPPSATGTSPQPSAAPPVLPTPTASLPTVVLSSSGPQPSAPPIATAQPTIILSGTGFPASAAPQPPDEPRPRSGLPVLRPPSVTRKEDDHD